MDVDAARRATATRRFTVGPDDTARVDGREIHPVLGTVPLAAAVESVCRGLLVDHLEPDEEGVGYRLEVVHHAPAPVGSALVLTATVTEVDARRLLCAVRVEQGDTVVATATFEQRVLPRDRLPR